MNCSIPGYLSLPFFELSYDPMTLEAYNISEKLLSIVLTIESMEELYLTMFNGVLDEMPMFFFKWFTRYCLKYDNLLFSDIPSVASTASYTPLSRYTLLNLSMKSDLIFPSIEEESNHLLYNPE